jgi:integrase
MIRRRTSPDGLPFRVYAEKGKRRISYVYKHRDGTREPLASARLVNREECAEAKRTAIMRGTEINEGAPADSTVAALFDAYFKWQHELPETDERKKAASTLTENEREAKLLKKVFGEQLPDELTTVDLYHFQDLRVKGLAGPKANKELALLSAVLEYGRARGRVTDNVARGIKRVPTKPSNTVVTWAQLVELRSVAQATPAWSIMALAAMCAWLCVRRVPEILGMSRAAVTPEGLKFTGSKRKAGAPVRTVTIEWSPALREVIDAALAAKRHKVSGTFYIFGNLAGQKYSKSGWGTMWGRLQDRCAEENEGWERFTLMDCRPGGVTSKKERGDQDTQDATLHEDGRMVERIYDRRRDRKAKPAG